MLSDNCLYNDSNGGKTTAYNFTKSIHNIINIDMDDIRYQSPSAFIHMITEDDIVSMVKYHRYHDYICSSIKSDDFTKLLNMVNIYWELNDHHLLSSKNIDGMRLRKNTSINKILLNYFQMNMNIAHSTNSIKTMIYKELMVELSLRIEWEESKILNVIKNYRLINNNENITKWISKYIEYENNSRDRWYNFLIKTIELTMNKVAQFVNNETVINIKNINYDELIIPINNCEIYDDDRYEYLLNFNLNKIQLINGLLRIVENGNIITTSNICNSYTDLISFKSVVSIPEPININNNVLSSSQQEHMKNNKKIYPRRKQQMEYYFGTDDINSNIKTGENGESIPNLILMEYKRYDENKINRRAVREKKRDDYLAGVLKGQILINNSKNKTSRKAVRENNINQYINNGYIPNKVNSGKLYDNNKNVLVVKNEDMKKFELIEKHKLLEYKCNFTFTSFISNNKCYILKNSLKTIKNYYFECEKKGKLIQNYICDLYNKVFLDDTKNKSNNLPVLFKMGKINSDIYYPKIFNL